MKKMLLGIAATILLTSSLFASSYSDYLENPEKNLRSLEMKIIVDKQNENGAVRAGTQQAFNQLFEQAGVSTSLKLQQTNGTDTTLNAFNLIKSFDNYSKHLVNDYQEKDNMLTKYLIFNSRGYSNVDMEIINTYPDFEGSNARLASSFMKQYYSVGGFPPIYGFSIVYNMIVRNNYSDINFVGHNAPDMQNFTSAISKNDYKTADKILIDSFSLGGTDKDNLFVLLLVMKYSTVDN